jgi:hypothetical protein
MTETVCPSANKDSTKWEPINPAPPVTSTFISRPARNWEEKARSARRKFEELAASVADNEFTSDRNPGMPRSFRIYSVDTEQVWHGIIRKWLN